MSEPNAGGDAPRVPAKLAHFVVRTPRYEETVRWYETVLGARVVFGNPMLSFLTYDDEHHRVAVINMPGLAESPGRVAGIDHVAFTYAGLGDLLHTYRRLKEAGIAPYWCINHGPTTSLYYRDPNGIQVELQIDNFTSDEELRVWLRSGAFRRNPIGVEFDADLLCERFDRGDPVAELVRQGSAPRPS
jgi:catechol 2,3-dioxygenase-like lactoylglutathione lyase family enzyme